ncbi:MAG: hypothetical protein GY810_15555 [Aureispira sp.]|nr:hypothetical protein [Aureispira sp.]
MNSFAQNPAYFVLGEKQFSNTDIYTLLYDDYTDILYVGTNDGLYAYSQNRFVRFKNTDKQIGNSLFDLRQDSKGVVYCSNLNGQVFKIEEQELKLVYTINTDQVLRSFQYFIDIDNTIIIVTTNDVRVVDFRGKDSIILNLEKLESAGHQINRSTAYFIASQQPSNKDIYLTSGNSKKLILLRKQHVEYLTNTVTYQSELTPQYFKLNRKLFGLVERKQLIANLKDDIKLGLELKLKEKFSYLNDSAVIGLDPKNGARIIGLKNDTLVQQQHFFDKEFLSTAAVNNKGTLFLGTFGNGIFVVPHKKVIRHTYDGLFLGIAASLDNEVYLSSRSGEVYKYQKELQLIDKVRANVDAVFYRPNNFKFKQITEANILYDTYSGDYGGLKDVYWIDSNTLLMSDFAHVALWETTDQSFVLEKKVISRIGRCASVVWSATDSLAYYTTKIGVLSKPITSVESLEEDTLFYEGKAFIANDLVSVNDKIFCATSEHGILVYKKKELIAQFSKKNGLLSNRIKKIEVQDSILYLLGNEGLQLLDLKTKEFIGLGVAEGLITDGVTNFSLSQDKLWLLEKHAFYTIELSTLKTKNLISKLSIDSILVNDNAIDHRERSSFSYQENKMGIYFDYRNIESKSETVIQYTLEGFYDEWKTVETMENLIEFQSLPVGQYQFKIKAFYRSQETETFEYSFSISPPYWKTWWFYSLVIAVLLAIVFLVTRHQFRLLQKKNKEALEKQELKTNLLDSELKALRSQMNPHFIFNSLNSIQGLILQEDTDASYDYIVLFANLVRSVLNYSNKEFIPIDKELEFLEVYLQLEKLRFGDDFSYTINYTGNRELMVPSLIVQPFIENALVHGLLHKKGLKTLSITFEHSDDELKCTIIDNGVGRKRAQEIQERQGQLHESFALGAIKKRLEILGAALDVELGFVTTDLYENDAASGTRIEVVIPFKNPF